jgi:hypothetical protein
MQFATIALFILVILLPGFIFRKAYSRWGIGEPYRPVDERPLTEQVPSAIVVSAIFHAVWIEVCYLLQSPPVNLKALLMILLGNFGKDSAELSPALDSLSRHPYLILSYFVTICLAASVFGVVLKWLVRGLGLDLYVSFLRFDDDWFYQLTGERERFGVRPWHDLPRIPNGVVLTAIVAHEKDIYQYTGAIEDYFYGRDGELERVVLVAARRRKMGATGGADEVFTDKYVMLKYSDMSAMRLSYVWVEPGAESPPGGPGAPEPAAVAPT